MTYPKNLENAKRIAHESNSIIQNDTEEKGSRWNSLRSWEIASLSGTHGMVLQDDLELCGNFMTAVYKVVTLFPTYFISIFNPYPHVKNIEKYNELYSTHYSFTKHRLFPFGHAWIIPQCSIVQMLDWISLHINPTPFGDPMYSLFHWHNEIEILSPIYSLVQNTGSRKTSYKPNQGSGARAPLVCKDGITHKFHKQVVVSNPDKEVLTWLNKWSPYLK